MILSYSFETRITSGYLKGTPSAGITLLVDNALRKCAGSAGHPLLLAAGGHPRHHARFSPRSVVLPDVQHTCWVLALHPTIRR